VDRSEPVDEYAFVADLYDYVTPYRARQDVPFFVQAASRYGGPVLEVGCGTGRVLVPTARAGFDITGLDLSAPMLEVCRHRLSHGTPEVQARVRLTQGDMRRFDLGRQYSLVTMPFRPFQHLLSVEDQMACLECVRRHLAPGGRLILDLFNPSLPALARDNIGQEFGDEPEFSAPDGRRVMRRQKIVARDYFNQVIHAELIHYVTHPDGREEQIVHKVNMRYLFRFEAEHLLARSGYEIEHLYADYDESPYGSRRPGELIFVARRP